MERDFILSGEKERLKDIMVKRLKESGWANKVEQLIHDIIDQKVFEKFTSWKGLYFAARADQI